MLGSDPTRRAGSSRRSANRTRIRPGPGTRWWLVRMYPSGSTTKPEPSPRRGTSSAGASMMPSCGLSVASSITSTWTTAAFTRATTSAKDGGAPPKPRGAAETATRPPPPAR